jgi:two-component system, cell cycle sensor histidine kinase and response regulator CckA
VPVVYDAAVRGICEAPERVRLSDDQILRLSIDNLIEGVQVIGFDWVYRYVNATAAAHGRLSRDELVGQTVETCYPGIRGTSAFTALQRVMTTRVPERLVTDVVCAGTPRSFELRIEPVPEGLLVLSLDVTDHRDTMRQFLQAQKMGTIGRLAGGIAHDFNNLLTAILGYSELVLARGLDVEVEADIREIQKAGERAARLTRQLLAFSKKQGLVPQLLKLAELLAEIQPMLRRLMPDVQVDVNTAGAADVYVYADPGQVEQIIVNLAVNARDAMPGGGRLRIAMEVLEVEQSNADRHGVNAGPHVAVMVQDTGTGMDTEVLARAFDPFFTTKGPQGGTGLGLSTVFAVVQQSGGFITVESELGVGTRFTIYLPTAAAPDQDRADARLPPVMAGGETVLLVEPDPDVARLLHRTLTSAGYVVLVGHTAAEALSIAERAGPIHLLIAELMMPGMHGSELAQALVSHHPELKVLYASGFPDTRAIDSGQASSRVALLAKPFVPGDLLRRVRALLDDRAAAPSAPVAP